MSKFIETQMKVLQNAIDYLDMPASETEPARVKLALEMGKLTTQMLAAHFEEKEKSYENKIAQR